MKKYKYLLTAFIFSGIIFAGSAAKGSVSAAGDAGESIPSDKENFDQELELDNNRLPLLLHDLKVQLTDVMIADVSGDSMEVLFLLDQIFDLLEEAEQFGEMTEEDQEEFSRFESTLIHVYSNQLQTIDKSLVAVDADKMNSEIAEYIEPVKVEIGDTKLTIIDDREGHVPLVHNQRVENAIKYFQTRGRDQFEIWLERYAMYNEIILDIINEHSLPEELIYLALIESGMNPKAYSRANAVGMWQFVYHTGKRYGLDRTWWIDERRDFVKATHAACAHLKDLYEDFDDWYLAMSAYNAGAGRIHRAVRRQQTSDYWQLYSLPRETRNYIPTYLAAALICRNPEKYGFTIPSNNRMKYDEVVLDKSADINVLARSAEISVSNLRLLNPELRQSATPSEGSYTLRIPPGSEEKFKKAYASLPDEQRFAPEYVYHKVRYGETLWDISKQYKVSIHRLAAENKIRNRHRIRVGQKLVIPVNPSPKKTTYTQSGPAGHTKVVYVVKKGDTLGHIAENYKTRASRIRRWNGLRYGQYIYPGQRLTVWVPQG